VSQAFDGACDRADICCSNEEDAPSFKDRRKQRAVFSPGDATRAGGDKPAKRPWAIGPRVKGRSGRVPAEQARDLLDFGTEAGKINVDNVVDLRPRLLEHSYAERLLEAVCAACEAQATGQRQLLMLRIKQVYHLFDDLERFSND